MAPDPLIYIRMKNFLCLLTLVITAGLVSSSRPADTASLNGAWQIKGDPGMVTIIMDGYFIKTVYREDEPEFLNTMGGTCSYNNDSLSGTIELNSEDPNMVGEAYAVRADLAGDELAITYQDGKLETWTRVDDGKGPLAGVWRITQRQNDEGEMNPMKEGPRKTLKILSGTRFQWAAINTETGEFFGTGGGTYTFENGKYTENIKFFSRDNSRVGASLSFEGEVKGDDWHHRGLSSRGDPIYEVWSKQTSSQ